MSNKFPHASRYELCVANFQRWIDDSEIRCWKDTQTERIYVGAVVDRVPTISGDNGTRCRCADELCTGLYLFGPKEVTRSQDVCLILLASDDYVHWKLYLPNVNGISSVIDSVFNFKLDYLITNSCFNNPSKKVMNSGFIFLILLQLLISQELNWYF